MTCSINEFVNQWEKEMLSIYDEGDPCMAPLGLDGWAAQVKIAKSALFREVDSATIIVENNLIDGQYFIK